MIRNEARIGNFTSSEIYKLTKTGRDKSTWGAPALDYIYEKRIERKLGRSISGEVWSKPTSWGKTLELFVANKLDWDYELTSQLTIVHPDFDWWSGSPDGTSQTAVFDIKCPMTLKSFCGLVFDSSIESIRADHADGEKYYWQLVSNAILTGKDFAELIVYAPYQSDLEEIKLHALDYDAAWIANANDLELPYLLDGGYFKDINIIWFEVPQSDKDRLTDCVKRAGEMLLNG